MSYVDKYGSVRWTAGDHTARSEAYVRARIPHDREHILVRRLFAFVMYLLALMLPDALPAKVLLAGFGQQLTPDALQELQDAAVVYQEAEALKDAGVADAAMLESCLDLEDVQAALAAIPAVPDDGSEDLFADARAQAQAAQQALLAAASPDVLQLLADRAARRVQPTMEAA